MKKLTLITVAIIFIKFSIIAAAQACPWQPIQGMAGIEISGNSYVGAQLVNTQQVTHGGTNDCFSWSNYKSVSCSVGGIISSGAAGMACLKTTGNARGHVSGTGTFTAGASGSMFGCNYYTSSIVNIQAVGH